MKEIYSLEEITNHMQKAYPSDRCDYESIAKKYIRICVHELCQAYGRPESNKLVLGVYVNTICNKIKNTIVDSQGNTQYWYKWLSIEYPFWTVEQIGHNLGGGKPSMVKPHFELETLVAFRNRFKIIDDYHINTDNQLHYAQIDANSIANYTKTTAELICSKTADIPSTQLAYRFDYAKSIEDIASEYNWVLPQEVAETQSARTYYKGINLINAPVVVREAALGKSFKQDLTSCMYAFKLGIVEQYYQKQGIDIRDKRLFVTFRQLVHEKSTTRKLLAKTITRTNTTEEHKQKLVKEALSAIGFGARINNSIGALVDIIYQPQDREAFIQHYIVQDLIREQRLFSDICRAEFSKETIKEIMPEALRNGRYDQSKTEVYLYQWFERCIMDFIEGHPLTQSADPLLTVHDCIYTRTQIDPAINLDLQEKFGNRHLCLEAEQIDAWRYSPPVKTKTDRELRHELHLQAEQIKAQSYVPKTPVIETSQTWNQWKAR